MLQNKKGLIFTLEYPEAFLTEQWSKAYKKYVARVAQVKMMLGAKNALQRRALLDFERQGVQIR